MLKDVVIISDSTLDLPGVKYALTRMLRKLGFNLVWIVSKAGAGAKGLGKAWRDAPPCHWGLTVKNLNDGLKNNPWCLTSEDLQDVKELLELATARCAKGHELFVNNADFSLTSVHVGTSHW